MANSRRRDARIGWLKKVVLVAVGLGMLLGPGASIARADNVLDGGVHWERFGTSNAYMYVEDYTGYDWPVYDTQVEWNYSCCVGAYYASAYTCSYHCVVAQEIDDINEGVGVFIYYGPFGGDGSQHFPNEGSQYIFYNNAYGLDASQRRSLTCQEQGHALGLDHRSTNDSCMMQNVDYSSDYPDQHDYDTLQYDLYNH